MVDVVKERCGEKGCLKRPSYDVAGSKQAELCFEHATVGIVNVRIKTCGEEGCLKRPS